MHDKILVFDLDATLYYVGNAIEEECDKKVCRYLADHLQISLDDARELMLDIRRKYKYETEAIEKELPFSKYDFIEDVCAVDVSSIPQDRELDAILQKISNPKYILTDSTQRHVADTLHQLSVKLSHFSGIFDAHDMDYTFKYNPEAYQMFLHRFKLKPKDCIMFEDSLTNLAVAKSLGLSTVLISPSSAQQPDFVDYMFSDIKTALLSLNKLGLNSIKC